MPTTTGPFALLARFPGPAARSALLAAWLLLTAGALAQEPPDVSGADAAAAGDAGDEADSSRRVDESEESFRARMELREQRFRDRQPSNTTFSYSVNREGKLANLPPESQKHIREQLSDLVIESRLWEPGEDLTGYPYEPSPAARSNGVLARQEREAWDEQLQNYQEREAAAHAASGTEGDRAGPAPDGSQAGAAQQRSAATSRGAAPAGSPGAAPGSQQPGAAEPHTEGVTESALDYLRQRGVATGGAPEGMAGEAGASDATEPGAAALATLGSDASDAGPARLDGDGETEGEQAAESGQQAAAGAAEAGTLDIDDLQQIGFALAPAGGMSAGSSASAAASGAANAPAAAAAGAAAASASPAADPSDPEAGREAGRESPARDEAEQELDLRFVSEEEEAGTLDIEALRGLDPRSVSPDPARAGDR